MTRHGRNNTASACYTYHERNKDAKIGNYGTLKARLGAESVKDFDACSLSLQPCRCPVITREGFIYEKEAILEYILTKRADNLKKLKDFEKQNKSQKREADDMEKESKKQKSEFFEESQRMVSSVGPSTSTKPEDSLSNMTHGRDKELPSFWVPQMCPQAKESLIKKPDTNVYCPMTGNKITSKDLMAVNFTPIDAKNVNSPGGRAKRDKYMCPVTHDILRNSVTCCFLKTSGSVVTKECVDKLILKDMIDPVNGKTLQSSDIIEIQRGGTGFSSTNNVEAAIKKPVCTA